MVVMKDRIKVDRKLAIVGVLLIICLAAALVMFKGNPGGIVDDEAATRSRPKTTPAGMVDPNIISKGTNSWQGQNYMNTAKSANILYSSVRILYTPWSSSPATSPCPKSTSRPIPPTLTS